MSTLITWSMYVCTHTHTLIPAGNLHYDNTWNKHKSSTTELTKYNQHFEHKINVRVHCRQAIFTTTNTSPTQSVIILITWSLYTFVHTHSNTNNKSSPWQPEVNTSTSYFLTKYNDTLITWYTCVYTCVHTHSNTNRQFSPQQLEKYNYKLLHKIQWIPTSMWCRYSESY